VLSQVQSPHPVRRNNEAAPKPVEIYCGSSTRDNRRNKAEKFSSDLWPAPVEVI
jgi:hypothetical protein